MARPEFKLTEEQKKQAELYIKRSGFGMYRFADYLGIAPNTLRAYLKRDKSFCVLVNQANAFFYAKTAEYAQKKNPYELLKTQYPDDYREQPQKHEVTFVDADSMLEKIDERVKRQTGGQPSGEQPKS